MLLERLLRRRAVPQRPEPLAISDALRFLSELFQTHRTSDLDQALVNLVLNAAEAAAGGESLVVVTPSLHGEIVKLTVEDDGPGVEEAILPCLFEPFTTTRAAEGHRGLGLSTSRYLLAPYGGEIHHERPDTRGARFIIRLRTWSRGLAGTSGSRIGQLP